MGVLVPVCQVHASRSHSSCCSHGRTNPAGSRSPKACLHTGYQSHSSCCRGGTKPEGSRNSGACLPGHGLQEGSAAVLLAPGSPGARLLAWVTRSNGSCCRHRGSKAEGSGSSRVCLLVQQLLLAWRTKPAAHSLGHAYTGTPVSLAFQGKGSR
jgi:hypothetical protein